MRDSAVVTLGDLTDRSITAPATTEQLYGMPRLDAKPPISDQRPSFSFAHGC